ncbi:GATA transcription factor 5 isoform X2 [Quercus suber]|nr:GATA transcription factor 5-like isoform X2 [Quercus suber]
MEYCVEARALKSSLRGEILAMKTTTQVFEDFRGSIGVGSEDFPVDDLLDLSNAEFEDGYFVENEEEEEEEEKDFLSVSSSQDDENSNSNSNSNSNNFSGSADSEFTLASELAVPDDDLAGLEWVSHFVDDSISEFSFLYPAGKQKTEANEMDRSEPESRPVLDRASRLQSPLEVPFPSKARTKRSRASNPVWSLASSWFWDSNPGSPRTEDQTAPLSHKTHGFYDTSSLSSLSSSGSCSSGLSSSPSFFNNMFNFVEPAKKKQKKKSAVQTGSGTQFQRRCSHCQVQKTPQWRTGPLGAKTLCNACGVRYKSGRLFPEYRPACSPTFSGEIHSNSHRKVLEMRKRKETVTEPESRLNQMVSSF